MDPNDDLRSKVADYSAEEWHHIASERELKHYHATNRYCGSCGAETRPGDGLALVCSGCGRLIFPGISPAIVVLVTRDDKALLVHARTFRDPVYALVAGFVEPGESLEECVAREVMEETGLEIGHIKYQGSQAWPFPSQIMMGFTAKWKSGEIEFRDGELSAGGWFSRDSAPRLARRGSISRRLIDEWLGEG